MDEEQDIATWLPTASNWGSAGSGGVWSTLAAALDIEQWTPSSPEVVCGD